MCAARYCWYGESEVSTGPAFASGLTSRIPAGFNGGFSGRWRRRWRFGQRHRLLVHRLFDCSRLDDAGDDLDGGLTAGRDLTVGFGQYDRLNRPSLCWRLRFLDRRRRWRRLLNSGSGLLRWRFRLRSGRVGLRFLRSDGLLRGWLLLCRRLRVGSGRVGLGGRLLGGRIRLGCGLLWLWLFVAHVLFPSNQRPRNRFAQKFACGFQNFQRSSITVATVAVPCGNLCTGASGRREAEESTSTIWTVPMRQSQQTTTMVPTSTLLVLFALAPSSCAHQFTTRPHLSSSLRPAVSLSARAPPIQALALPVVTPDGILPLALCSGAIGLAQLGLTGLFRASKDPVLSGAPGYTAHQVVAFFLMAFVAALGLVGWLNPPAVAATAAGRLLAPSNSARWLGAMLLGMLVAWDIPTSIAIPRLRKPDVLTHHIAMAAVAFVGAFFLPTRYGFYYMGVAELSSIPLTAYDLFERSAEVAGVESASSGTDMDKARAKRLEIHTRRMPCRRGRRLCRRARV